MENLRPDPLIPGKAGIQSLTLGPRFRGDNGCNELCQLAAASVQPTYRPIFRILSEAAGNPAMSDMPARPIDPGVRSATFT